MYTWFDITIKHFVLFGGVMEATRVLHIQTLGGIPHLDELCTKREKYTEKMSPHLSKVNVAMAHRKFL